MYLATADQQIQVFSVVTWFVTVTRYGCVAGVKGALHIIKQEVSVAYLVKFTNRRCTNGHLYVDTVYS